MHISPALLRNRLYGVHQRRINSSVTRVTDYMSPNAWLCSSAAAAHPKYENRGHTWGPQQRIP